MHLAIEDMLRMLYVYTRVGCMDTCTSINLSINQPIKPLHPLTLNASEALKTVLARKRNQYNLYTGKVFTKMQFTSCL